MKDAEVREVKDAEPSEPMKPNSAKPGTPERCDNGEDDDGDGLIDCADQDCAAVRCIDVAPSGWQGPVAFRTATDPITCAGVFDQPAFEAGSEPEAAAAICSTCSCTGGCSQFVDFQTSNAEQCAGTSCSTSVNANCIEISPQCLQNATTAYLKTALPSSSGCTASVQRPTLPQESWKTHAAACRASDARRGGCKAEQLCLPATPSGGFEPDYCIWREGEHACPSANFTERRLYYRTLDDTRTCSPCTCAAPSCNYKWRIYNLDDATCATPILELSSVDQCAQINPGMGKLRVGATTPSGGSCSAAGGESRGTVSAAKPLTVCCGG